MSNLISDPKVQAVFILLLAVVVGLVYYILAAQNVIADLTGCLCDWEPYYQAILLTLAIALLALWPLARFDRFGNTI